MPRYAVWDNGGKTLDRYTVIASRAVPERDGTLPCLGLSDMPTDAQGFSQWGTARRGPHLGQRVPFNSLPAHIRAHIAQRYAVG